jgi:predicted DNA-binding protein (MmcQ/YjbR family)
MTRARPRRGTEELDAVHSFALGLPEAWEDHPWDGGPVVKVGKKIFVFLGQPAGPSMSVKLPFSGEVALTLDGCTPTGYGLGRAGWVSIDLTSADCPDVDVLLDWVEESYRVIAPKKLVARLDAEDATDTTDTTDTDTGGARSDVRADPAGPVRRPGR